MAVRVVFALLIMACCITASPFGIEKLINITITVPDQTQIHNNPKQICIPPKWSDYLVFYLGNYLAHVVTVQTYPGESSRSTLKALGFCLLFPASGISRGLTTITRCAIRQKTPLQTAARAGALCMVVRSKDWLPATGDSRIDGLIVRAAMKTSEKPKPKPWSANWMLGKLPYASEYISKLSVKRKMLEDGSPYDGLETSRRLRVYWPPWAQELSKHWNYYDTNNEHINPQQKVHGFCRLSEGYSLAHVPRDAVVHPWSSSSSGGPHTTPSVHEISATYSFPKAFIAVVQLTFSSFTLYESFGNQITKYGYAAFGLTVTPYALMSLINLLGSLLTPSYPALYLVHSSVLDEARDRDSVVDGVVGALVELETPKVEGAELIAGRFTSRIASKDAVDSVTTATATQQVQLAFRVPSSHLWSQNTTLNIITKGASDPKAPAVFVPSCPCFERQKKYQYEVFRRSGYETLNGKWNPEGKRERDQIQGELGAVSMAAILVSALSIAIIGAMSGFHARESTILQRVITMTWVTFGIYLGSRLSILLIVFKEITLTKGYLDSSRLIFYQIPFLGLCFWLLLKFAKPFFAPREVKIQGMTMAEVEKLRRQALNFWTYLAYCAPSIAGFVLVGLMIRDYGACITVGK